MRVGERDIEFEELSPPAGSLGNGEEMFIVCLI